MRRVLLLALCVTGAIAHAQNFFGTISTIDCRDEIVALTQGHPMTLENQRHSLRVSWLVEKTRFEFYNYFLKDSDLSLRPMMALQKTDATTGAQGSELVDANTSAFEVDLRGRVTMVARVKKLLVFKNADGSSRTFTIGKDGAKLPWGRHSVTDRPDPTHINYTTTIAPDALPADPRSEIRSGIAICTEEALPANFLSVKTPSIFETKVAQFDHQFAILNESQKALAKCQSDHANCPAEERAFGQNMQTTEELWEKLIAKPELEHTPFARLRHKEHLRWLKAQRQVAREKKVPVSAGGDYYGDGGISEETRRKLDCLHLDQAANHAGIQGVGGILSGSSLCP